MFQLQLQLQQLLLPVLCATVAAAGAAAAVQPIDAIDRFISSLTVPVQTMLDETGRQLDTAFGSSTRDLCDAELFANGSYAENFNSTRTSIVDTLDAIRLDDKALRQRARLDLQRALRELRGLPHATATTAAVAAATPADAGDYEHDVIRLAYIYQQYERGYRFVHREYRADVQCNYALMYDRGLAVANLTETGDTAHVSYQNIVQKVRRINVANRRDIAEQTEILLRNVATSMRLIGRGMRADQH